jgi:hypothetical protein
MKEDFMLLSKWERLNIEESESHIRIQIQLASKKWDGGKNKICLIVWVIGSFGSSISNEK